MISQRPLFRHLWCVVTILLTIFVAAPLMGGGQAEEPDDEIVIRYWHHEAPDHRVEAFERVNQMFEAENPGVRVEQEVVLWGDAWPQTLSALEAGTLPDFQFSIPDLTMTMFREDALAPVTDLVEELDAEYSFNPQQRDIYAHDDEYWGVPVFTMSMIMTYRPSLIEEHLGMSEIPDDWTWEDAAEAAREIYNATDGAVGGIGLGGARDLMTSEQFYIFLRGAGADIFDEDGNIVFDSPETVEAIETYASLFEHAPAGSEAWSFGEMESNIAAGNVAMAPYFAGVQRRLDREYDTDDYAASHIPFFPGRDERGTITYPNDVHIYQSTLEDPERYEAVKEFIRFIMRPDVNAELTAGSEPGTFYPVTDAAMEADEYWDHPIVQRYEDMHHVAIEALFDYSHLYGFEHGRWVNLGIGDISGANVLAEVVHNVVAGDMTPEEAAEWGAAEMEQYSEPVPR